VVGTEAHTKKDAKYTKHYSYARREIGQYERTVSHINLAKKTKRLKLKQTMEKNIYRSLNKRHIFVCTNTRTMLM
jgi:hypothetical protein